MTQNPEVVIVGIGALPVGYHFDLSLRSMAVQAILQARREAPEFEPQAVYVGNMLAAGISHQANLGALICEYANLRGAEGSTIEQPKRAAQRLCTRLCRLSAQVLWIRLLWLGWKK